MQWITILAIGIAANIDNLGISMAYGLRASRIPFIYNLLISIISAMFALLAMMTGNYLSDYLSFHVANVIGGTLLIGLGIWIIFHPTSKTSVPRQSTTDMTVIGWKESVWLGFILAFNCLAIGFSAGITGVPVFSTSAVIGVCSFISIAAGIRLGQQIGLTWIGRHADRIGGGLLIVIGVIEVIV